ncbi:MAG: cytochrome c oxidase assembly protein [Blastocatellia bacterium]
MKLRRVVVAVGRQRLLRRAWRFLLHPVVAWLLHAAVLWAWHVPALFQATLTMMGCPRSIWSFSARLCCFVRRCFMGAGRVLGMA